MDRPRINLSKEELDRAEIPLNHVLIRMIHTGEGATTKGGVIIGFLTDDVFAEGDDSHSANLAEFYGVVARIPDALFFDKDDPKTMDWETECELIEDDIAYFSLIETKNANEVICDGVIYRSIPYQDIYAYKREVWVNKWEGTKKTVRRAINGYVLCSPVYFKKLSHLDSLSGQKIDKARGIVAFVSELVKSYLRDEYCHIDDIQVGDEVLFDPKAAPFFLERTKELATFNGNELYWVIHMRRISLILNR